MKSKCEINKDGDKRWYLNGLLHREDGPAIEYISGDKFWYSSGKLHREGGPAIEYINGDKIWYINGKRHREGGPAIEYINGDKCWCLNGKYLTKQKFINYKRYCKICNNQLRHMKALNTDIFYCERCKR